MTTPAELTWRVRFTLAIFAFAGSTVYAWSFSFFTKDIVPLASAVGIAAGLSWICFGALLLGVTRLRVKPTLLADVCLRAMAVGIAIKMMSVFLNFTTIVPGLFHCVMLLVANLAMAVVFAIGVRTLGIALHHALVLWFVGLNGIFAIAMCLLNQIGMW